MNPANHWNPVPGNQESTAWNPEFKAVSVSPTWGGILLSASKIVFGRWNSKYTGRTSRPSPVADQGEGLGGPGTPLISGSKWPPSPLPPPPPPPPPPFAYLKVWVRLCSRIYYFTFNNSSFSAIDQSLLLSGKMQLMTWYFFFTLLSCGFLRYI